MVACVILFAGAAGHAACVILFLNLPVNFMSHVWISGLLTIEDLYIYLLLKV